MLNPDGNILIIVFKQSNCHCILTRYIAKPGKAARRRATSMETSKYEKKRGRIRKKIEAMRNGISVVDGSPCSSLSEGLDLFPEEVYISHCSSSNCSSN
jgi:hypothetical protein